MCLILFTGIGDESRLPYRPGGITQMKKLPFLLCSRAWILSAEREKVCLMVIKFSNGSDLFASIVQCCSLVMDEFYAFELRNLINFIQRKLLNGEQTGISMSAVNILSENQRIRQLDAFKSIQA